MSIEDKDELAQEFAEFGYRETSDPKDADRRNFYKVEKWDAAELRVELLIHASNEPGVCKSDLRHRKKAPTARWLHVTPRHPRPGALAARCAALIAKVLLSGKTPIAPATILDDISRIGCDEIAISGINHGKADRA